MRADTLPAFLAAAPGVLLGQDCHAYLALADESARLGDALWLSGFLVSPAEIEGVLWQHADHVTHDRLGCALVEAATVNNRYFAFMVYPFDRRR